MGEQHHHPKLAESATNLPVMRTRELRRLSWVMLLTFVTMIAEFIGGWMTGSLALLGDAFHMLTHLLAVGISYFAIRIAMMPAAPEKTYRNWRAEILGSLFSAIALLPLAGFVLYEAIERFLEPGTIDVWPMLGVAFLGLVVNLICAKMLHAHSHDDLNVRGAFLHLIADTASSVGVMLAGVAILIWPQAAWADPVAAGLITVMILVWAVGLFRQSCSILLEAVPTHIKLDELTEAMKELDGVEDVHDLHVWTITSKMHSLTAHVRLDRDMSLSETEDIAEKLKHLLDDRFHINHPTFQFEISEGQELHCEREVSK